MIDRFEGKWAVLLLGDDEKSVSVPKKSLPRRVQAMAQSNKRTSAGISSAEVLLLPARPGGLCRVIYIHPCVGGRFRLEVGVNRVHLLEING